MADLADRPRRLGRSDPGYVDEAGPPDADGWRTLPLAFDGFEEARAGMLQLGVGVEVLSPVELREGIRDVIRELAAPYRARPSLYRLRSLTSSVACCRADSGRTRVSQAAPLDAR